MNTEAVNNFSKRVFKAPVVKTAVALRLPESLFNKIKLDSQNCKTPICSMVEAWIDQHVSLQEVSFGLASLMNATTTRRTSESGVNLKNLTVTLSRLHYNKVKMEAIRQQTTIRALLKGWIEENVSGWDSEPVVVIRCEEAC